MIAYLPPVLRDAREFSAIMGAEQTELEAAWKAADNLLANQFIETADELGVSRWERVLGITPRGTDTLGERKFVILAAIENQLPYTMRQLLLQLTFLCGPDGFAVALDHNNYFLKVLVALTARRNFDAVKELLQEVVPANIRLLVSIQYNQHMSLASFTHAALSNFTHHQLRNDEVFDNGD